MKKNYKQDEVWIKDISPENAGLLADAIRKGIQAAKEARQKAEAAKTAPSTPKEEKCP